MRYTFEKNESGVQCICGDGPAFSLSQDPAFENRDFRFWQDSFLFDGYSHFFRGTPNCLRSGECFTVSLCFLPLTYSAYGDGLFTFYREQEHKGLEILLERGGVVTVTLGLGPSPIRFSSIRAHARAGVQNVVTVVFRGDAGWCDLYVNGVFSNRKQFRRHTTLSFPEGCPYIGRRMDGGFFTEQVPFGCYYGFMRWIELSSSAPAEEEIFELHRSVYTGAQEEEAFQLGMPRRSAYRFDRQRPVYHLSPAGKWMNEPHGPLYYDSFYHIFYQANPHAPIWDHLCWGHLRSRDMVHWQDCPLALIPEKESCAPDGCWSGSSVIGKDGVPRIYFTAGDDSQFPNQAVALALPEDGALTRWHTRPQLVQAQDIGWMGEFRDPFVWLEGDTYFMLVGTGDARNGGGGNAALYSSRDGIQWESHGFFVRYDYASHPEGGHVWELPVLLPLRDETGAVTCHILLFCACQIEHGQVETYYFLGHWDPEALTFTRLHDEPRLLDLGGGVFTGPSGLVTPDGRTVVFTIAQGRRGFRAECRAGWAHNGGLPQELSIRDGQLRLRPIREIEALRGDVLLSLSDPDGANTQLARHPGDQLCLEYIAGGDKASVTLCYGDHRREICYDRTAQRLGIRDEQGQALGVFRGEADRVDIGGEPIRFTCYLDRSMLEIYLNGRKSVTLRNYTQEQRYFQVSGNVQSLTLWPMDSAY